MNFNFSNKSLVEKSSDSQTTAKTGFQFNFKKTQSTAISESQEKKSNFFQLNDSQEKKSFKFKFDSQIVSPRKSESQTNNQDSSNNSNDIDLDKPCSLSLSNEKFKFSLGNKLTFNFGTGKEFQAEEKKFGGLKFNNTFSPISRQQLQSKLLSTESSQSSQSSQSKDDDDKIENGAESEKTGEEDEEILLNAKAILYVYTKPEEENTKSDSKDKKVEQKPHYAERGNGELHFNYNKEQNFYRLVMRRKPIGTIVLNQRVFAGMKPKLNSKKIVQFLGQLTVASISKSDDAQTTPKINVLLLKLQDEESANKLLSLIQKAISEIK